MSSTISIMEKKCRTMFCKNIERCSAKLFSGVPHFPHKMNNFLVKTEALGLFPVTSIPFILGGQNITSNF